MGERLNHLNHQEQPGAAAAGSTSAPGRSSEVVLSVVIPAHNESARLPATLQAVLGLLQSRSEAFEVLVVDDGSTDDTAELVQRVCRESPEVRLLRHPTNFGKGAAVRNGMLNARGEYILFTDADLSAPIAEAERLLEPLKNGYDVAFGSRGLRPEWISQRQSRIREAAGRLFNFWTRSIAGLNFRDTQCGFKAFRRQAAETIFARQRISGFGFDVEVLYLARKFGYRVLEVPVHWAHCEGSTVHMLRDSARMFMDLLRIRWNNRRGKYALEAGNFPEASRFPQR
ncbi:MAG: glycosyltransferase family 2 protein [Acidobacteria bacterium]|nr:glycosyltransferase family 2 protein [Acidobacteriota bacterium]